MRLIDTYFAIVLLSSALIMTPDSWRYSNREIFCGVKMCITLLFLLKHIPSIGSKYYELSWLRVVASLNTESTTLCCTILKEITRAINGNAG